MNEESQGEGEFADVLWVELLKDAMDSRVSEINTCLPGKVTFVDPGGEKVNVLPTVNRLSKTTLDNLVEEPLPEFLGVKLAFPRGGNFVLYVPPQVGDYVLLVFPQYIISEWIRLGKNQPQVNPGDSREHSLGSAVAIAGIFPSGMEVSGLSATKAILGNPTGMGVSVEAAKVKLGNHSGVTKQVARKDDPVSVTITPAHIIALGLSNGGGPVVAASSATVSGQIQAGSTTVEASD
jgi:hypothetical protein